MKNIAEKLDVIAKQSEIDKSELDQLLKFDETMNQLKVLMSIEKPIYNFPQIDTIGKRTYSSLNKNCCAR